MAITAMKGKVPLAHARAVADAFCAALKYKNGRVARTVVAGSIRRKAKVVGDIDLIVVGVRWPQWPVGAEFIGGGDKQATFHFQDIQINVWRAKTSELGSMLLFATGSSKFGVRIRAAAKSRGFKLNRYGLYSLQTGKRVAGMTEQSIFDALGIDFVAPELRGKGAAKEAVATAPSSRGTGSYTVSRMTNGSSCTFHCECTGFKFRGKCWHVTETQRVLSGEASLPHPRGLTLTEYGAALIPVTN